MINEIEIFIVAKQLISHYGPQKTTMKDIAERLSISPPYLLKFFDCKSVFLLSLMKSINQDLYDEISVSLGKEFSLPGMVGMVLQLKMAQFKKYFRVVQSLSYLERLGSLEQLRQDYTDNNERIAALITEHAFKIYPAESSVFTQSLFELFQEADQMAEGYILKYIPHGRVKSNSFKQLHQELLLVKNNFVKNWQTLNNN